MRSRSLRRTASVIAAATAVAALAAAAAAPPAAALSPTVEVQQYTRSFTWSCPDFPVRTTFFVDRTVTTFYDADGSPIRQTIHGDFPGEVTNLATGYTLPAYNVRQIEIDLVTHETRSTGTNVRIWVPGGGTIQLTAGIQITDASGHLLLDGGRLDPAGSPELCAALAG